MSLPCSLQEASVGGTATLRGVLRSPARSPTRVGDFESAPQSPARLLRVGDFEFAPQSPARSTRNKRAASTPPRVDAGATPERTPERTPGGSVVSWADGTHSPPPSAQRLHKKARVLSDEVPSPPP